MRAFIKALSTALGVLLIILIMGCVPAAAFLGEKLTSSQSLALVYYTMFAGIASGLFVSREIMK